MSKNLFVVCLGLFALGFHSLEAKALDTSYEEEQCLDIGFKKKTQAFANCVLELVERSGAKSVPADPDDATCKKYGFRPKTDNYAACRQQIDLARQQAQQQQAIYAQQKAEYEAMVAEQKKEKERQKGLAMLQLGLGMMSGKYNSGNGYGSMPPPPSAPQIQNQTYVLPGGKMMNCSTTGNVTSCF